jgi:hypothetical protein
MGVLRKRHVRYVLGQIGVIGANAQTTKIAKRVRKSAHELSQVVPLVMMVINLQRSILIATPPSNALHVRMEHLVIGVLGVFVTLIVAMAFSHERDL